MLKSGIHGEKLHCPWCCTENSTNQRAAPKELLPLPWSKRNENTYIFVRVYIHAYFALKYIVSRYNQPLACSVGDTSFPAQSSTWLHRYYLNWTKLDNAITKFNNEMHSADNWVLNPVILHYWQNLPILILCSALLQFVLLKALYK